MSSRVVSIAAWSSRSTLRIEGGLALDKPAPTVVHPALTKLSKTMRPRRPVAPVIKTVFAISSTDETSLWYFVDGCCGKVRTLEKKNQNRFHNISESVCVAILNRNRCDLRRLASKVENTR